MGIFDTYGDKQMKIGEPWQRQFNIGDSVVESAVDDGVYISDDGDPYKAIVIINGIFVAELDIFNYWGEEYDFNESEVK